MLTDSDVIEIVRLYEVEKLTLQQIAARFHITKQDVHYRLLSCGVIMRPRSPRIRLDLEIMVDLYANKRFSVAKVSTIVGVSPNTVKRSLQGNGVAMRPEARTYVYCADRRS